uniref:F-box/kelch-repeat protein At3g06240-like n=1 Tax=Erigeron canadensis TaxID=72917 RepID=UPI001CB9C1B5|nr:F-box/kelch-repeat protein At3g06240-like [Erigeron canadensis]
MKVATELPLDIIFSHILPRLPVKSIPRFKCVSKQWHSFLSSRMFAKTHLKFLQNDRKQNNLKLIVLSNTTPSNFCTIDCESPDDGFTSIRSLPFEASRENISLIASVNGLVCAGLKNVINKNEFYDLVLWNPLTGDHKVLFRTSSYKIKQRGFLFYYSSSEDDYKLVCITRANDVYIYSLKSNSWTKVLHRVSGDWIPSTALNEGIYLINQTGCQESCSIMKIDLRTKNFKIATLPLRNKATNNGTSKDVHTVIVGGQVRLFERYCAGDMLMIEWLRWPSMKGGRPKGTMVNNYPKYSSPWFLRPIHMMKNGNYLMHSEIGNHLCIVDAKRQTKQFLCSCTTRYEDIQIGAKFTETLESPNQYN